MQIQNMLQDHGKHGHQFQNTNTKYVLGSWATISKYKYKLCSRILVNMGSKYKAGVPELGLPAIDPLVVRRKSFSFPAMRKCLDSSDARDWAEPREQQGEVWGHCCKRVEQVCLVFHRTDYFRVFLWVLDLLPLSKDCVLTGWQVYCQVGQLWQSEQLYQVEHGLWQYGVNRWSFPFLN